MPFGDEVNAKGCGEDLDVHAAQRDEVNARGVHIDRVPAQGHHRDAVPIKLERRGTAAGERHVFRLPHETAPRDVHPRDPAEQIGERDRVRPHQRVTCEGEPGTGWQGSQRHLRLRRGNGARGRWGGRSGRLAERIGADLKGVLRGERAGRHQETTDDPGERGRPPESRHPPARPRMNSVNNRTPSPVGPLGLAGVSRSVYAVPAMSRWAQR